MPSLGPLEIGVILLIALLVIGPKKLPGLGRSLGSGMREFKDSVTGFRGDSKDDDSKKIDAAAPTAPTAEKSAAADEQPRGEA
ncbi:MAG: twin-arginine translocase TatA/TatE family subunit [Actinomycetes bacterium]